MIKNLIVAIAALGSASGTYAGTFSYDIESTTCSIADLSQSDISSTGLVLYQANSGKATYNYKIVYTPDADETVSNTTCTVSLVHMATVLGPNAVITSAAADPVIDGSTSATDATTVTTATAESSGTASSSTVTDPTTGLVLEHADGADGGGGIPLSDDCWTDVSWEAKSVTLTLQADGTYVGYVSIDTNTVTMASTDTIAGEVIQIDSISLGGGI